VPNLNNDWGLRVRSMGQGECCLDYGERVCQFISRKSSVTGDSLKLRDTREERESERSYMSQKDFGWGNAGPWRREQVPIVSRLGKGPLKVACFQMGVTPFQAMY